MWIQEMNRWRKPRWSKDKETMYCVNCACADILNDESNQLDWYGSKASEEIKQNARDAHEQCEDPKHCTCKHIVGMVLSPSQIAALQGDYVCPDYSKGKQ